MELIGKKIGMAQVFDVRGDWVGVTVVEVGPCTILQCKTPATDGYNAYQLAFGERREKSATRAFVAHCKKVGARPARIVREFRTDGSLSYKAGDQLTVKEFQVGEYVDVVGVSKGKGFQGVVRRHHFAGGNASHGAAGFHRRPGAIGQRLTPGRVFKNMKMPGHMGHTRITVQNLKIIQVREGENLLLIEGAVPGPTGAHLIVRHAKKKKRAGATV